MRKSKRQKLEKLGNALLRGGKTSINAIKKYGPIVQHHAKAISESTMDLMIPKRTRTFVDLTAKKRPNKIVKKGKGFYLDYTK